jgi:hypothetical protein
MNPVEMIGQPHTWQQKKPDHHNTCCTFCRDETTVSFFVIRDIIFREPQKIQRTDLVPYQSCRIYDDTDIFKVIYNYSVFIPDQRHLLVR